MIYEGTWNVEDNQYEFNVTGKKVYEDMMAGKLTVLNITQNSFPYSLLIIDCYKDDVSEETTFYEFHLGSIVETSLQVDGIFGGDEGNLIMGITK